MQVNLMYAMPKQAWPGKPRPGMPQPGRPRLQSWVRDYICHAQECHFLIFYSVSHSKEGKVILLWWIYRFWFLLRVYEIGPFMPNSSVFIFLMLRFLYRMIVKVKKKFFEKKSLNVPNVKLLSIFFSTFLPFLCLFGKNDSLHFTY